MILEPPHVSIGETVSGASGGGAILEYIYGRNPGASTGYLMCWNSTQALDSYQNNPQVMVGAGGAVTDLPTVTNMLNGVAPLDWEWGIMWNISVPLVSLPNVLGGSSIASWSVVGCDGQYVVLQTGKSDTNATVTSIRTLAAIKVDTLPITTTWTMDVGGDVIHPTVGSFAWVKNYTLPGYDETYTGGATLTSGGNIVAPDTNLLTLWDWDVATGTLKWAATPFKNDFAMQSMGTGTVVNGILYNAGYDGYMHAINATTGVEIWASHTAQGGLEMPQPYYPISGTTVAGGEVFCSTSKAYEAEPLYRGHLLYAFDATTGALNWNMSGQFSVSAVVDGKLIGTNNYDGKIYVFGMGQSATTVTAPMTSITAGSTAVIQGTVTDQTPGIAQGTPAISDQWMTPWMEYLTMDQPYPASATGVPVSIDTVDPNGNYVHIGNATSDISGTYSYQWTPPDVPGKYTIIATFSSDNSYYGSCGETAATVASAAPAAVAPTPTPTSVADMYFVPAIAGLAVLIIVGLIVLALLMLRKRP
jgi:outer membrane protein assembly factor BamB